MEEYEVYTITNLRKLKKPTVYFFLKSNEFSEHFIKNLRKTPNSIILNGETTNLRAILAEGDNLKILKNPNIATSTPACKGTLEILFEDDDFLIVNKPHNLACLPTRSHIDDNLGGRIVFYMQDRSPNYVLRVKNRLDKETAGIVITAKSAIAYNRLKDVQKEYYALCEGKFLQEKFSIDKPILTVTHNGINDMKRVISKDGKCAVTHVEVIKNSRPNLVKLTLETGRTHQIRVHLSSIGNSIFGDTLYGTSSPENHAFLLLKKIHFTHFRTGKEIVIEVPYPEDWKKYLI